MLALFPTKDNPMVRRMNGIAMRNIIKIGPKDIPAPHPPAPQPAPPAPPAPAPQPRHPSHPEQSLLPQPEQSPPPPQSDPDLLFLLSSRRSPIKELPNFLSLEGVRSQYFLYVIFPEFASKPYFTKIATIIPTISPIPMPIATKTSGPKIASIPAPPTITPEIPPPTYILEVPKLAKTPINVPIFNPKTVQIRIAKTGILSVV